MTRRDERGRSRSGSQRKEKDEAASASAVAKERSRSRRRRREEEKKPNRRRRDKSSSGGSSSGSRRRRKDKERDKRKKRDGHRERDREREREREKDKDRERQKEREKEKEREREKQKREKGKEPDKDKEPEKEKEADKFNEKDKERDKKRHSRSRSSSGSSSSARSKSRKVARLSGRFDQKELGKDEAAMQQALMVQAEQTKAHAVAPPIPAMMVGMPPPQVNAQVEEFLMHNPVEPHAAARLRALPFEYQQMVLARGSLMGARDPTAVVLGRIRAATQGTLQYSRDVMMWSPAMMQQMQSQGISVPGMTGIAQQPGGQPVPPQGMQAQQSAPQLAASKPEPPSPVAAPAPEPKTKYGGFGGFGGDQTFEKEKSSGRAAREDLDKEDSATAKKSATSALDEPSNKLSDDGPGSKKSSGWWQLDWRRSRPQVGEEAVEEGAAETALQVERTEEGQMEVRLLLMRAGVPEYLPKFMESGFSSMKAVRAMQEADMREKCGMTEEHIRLLQQDLAQVERTLTDGHETAVPRTAQGLVDIPPKQRDHFEKARPPVTPITSKGEPSLGQEGFAGDAEQPPLRPPPGPEAASLLPKLVRPPRPKEPGAPSAQVAHLQAAAAAAEAEAAAQARRAAEVEEGYLNAVRQNKQEPGSAAPVEKPMSRLPKFVPYKGPPVEPQPQPDVHLDPPEMEEASQFPFPGAGAPPMSWGPTVSQSPGLRLRPLIPGGMLNKDQRDGEDGAGPEVASPTGGAPSDAAGAGGERPAAPPKFSVADMLSMSGLKPSGGAAQRPEGKDKAEMDGQAPQPMEKPEAGMDASLLAPGLPPPMMDPNMMLDPGMMPPPLSMPPLPGLPPLPPLGPGLPPGMDAGMDAAGLQGLPSLPPLPQIPPIDPALEQQLQIQQDAAAQQAYQFWVQQQLNAQMALFENERSLISSRQSDQREVKPGPKKPSTQARLPGDWNCPGCGDHQFARNRTCRSCGALRPAETY